MNAAADSAERAFAYAVRCELADRLGVRIGLDTATRYLIEAEERAPSASARRRA